MSVDYRCLTCGSAHGEPASNASENWWWRTFEWGRVGPFHSLDCAATFSMGRPTGSENLFTLAEAMRLLEVSHRTNNVAS